MDPRVDDVLVSWFGPDAVPSKEITDRWYRKDPQFDAELRRRFGVLHTQATTGALEAWRGTAHSELALLVVLDQFSRNLFRDDPRAFACDDAALDLSRDLLASGRTAALTFHQRAVALLPFQHAEDPGVQADGIAAYQRLLSEARLASAPSKVLDDLTGSLEFAKKHQAIIDRFGRFPHRNATLGRSSTPEEAAFLTQPGSSF